MDLEFPFQVRSLTTFSQNSFCRLNLCANLEYKLMGSEGRGNI